MPAADFAVLGAALLYLFSLVAIAALLFPLDTTRDYVALALPVGLLGLLGTRALWGRPTRRGATTHRAPTAVLVVGQPTAARAVAAAFAADPASNYQVIGICTPAPTCACSGGGTGSARHQLPVVGDLRSVTEAVYRTRADAVVLTGGDLCTPDEFRRLAWDLEELGAELLLATGLIDVARDRVTSRSVSNMTVLHVARPRHPLARARSKTVFDLCFAGLALLTIAPTLLVIGLLIKLTSPGPVFYRSERIGMHGKPFAMLKFRSMYVDADDHVGALIDAAGGNPVFFKLEHDPRVTPIGRILRKYSLDELPQFLNVLRREMSVVGPRPQVRREVDAYDDAMRRRLLVKPGITGLWQVSGRSDLSLEQSMRLDVSYVDNWSMRLDLTILAKTIRTVARGDGAY
ncbi:sugar transferase [Nocardia brasiliensis]|uniref:sugar transferase n=1 Tax=Nocardia brasiliensis TaxID=37326 RepID=UPI001EE9B116|nr:sugar transferase [Nocardia brasiliensis]